MKKNIKCFIIYLLFVLAALASTFTSCGSKHEKEQTDKAKPKPVRVIKNNILLILGKDYYTRGNILQYLQDEYRLGKADSPVKVLSYPEFTEFTRQPRLKLIAEKIEEYESDIVISIGMPEGGGRYLISETEKNEKLTVISLVPMEEALPMEAGSDIVVDFKPPSDNINGKAAFTISDKELKLLLTAAVFAGEDIAAHNKNITVSYLEEFRQAFFTAQNILGKEVFTDTYTVKPFIDSDSGIPSRKFLLIYKNEDPERTDKDEQNIYDESDSEHNDIIDPEKLDGSA